MKLFPSSSRMPEAARKKVVHALRATLIDGIDLYGQIKIAHWNIKGPHFPHLHPLFDTMATTIGGFNDEIAERCVTLGGLALGTAKTVAKNSRLKEYPEDETRDLTHVKHLAERFATFVDGVKEARDVSDEAEDADTSDLLTGVVTECEKLGWFLRSTLEG
jgi:starvation-inducible DNA-binding protein